MNNRANAIYIQSGGPTAVINASAYGVMTQCRKQPEIDRIYASEHGIIGVITRRIFDITEELPGETFGNAARAEYPLYFYQRR